MPLTLPTSKSPPATREPRNLLLYGRPKAGKSTLCATLPNAIHLDTQHGTLFLETARVDVSTPALFAEAIAALPAHHAVHPFTFLIVDVVDSLEDWSESLATDYYRRLPMGKTFTGESVLELDRGAGYRFLRQEFKRLLFPALANPLWKTVFVGHVRDKYSDGSKTEALVVEGDLDLTGKCKSILTGLMDAIGFVYRDAMGTLKLTFATRDQLNCGNRCAHLAGQTLAFSTPPKPSEWARVYPDSVVVGAPATVAPAATPATA